MTTLVVALLVGLPSFMLGLLSHRLQARWDEGRCDRRTRRRIARALIPDLQEISFSIRGLGDPIKWDSIELPPHNWPKHTDALAEAVHKPNEWLTICGVFEEVQAVAEEAERHQWPDELDDFETRRLEDLYQSIRRALDLLHKYAGPVKPPRRARRLRRRHRLRERLRFLRLALRSKRGAVEPIR